MSKKIAVKLDIYQDYFNRNPHAPYVYGNIRAINLEESELLNECLQQMKNVKQNTLLDIDMVLPQNYINPIEQDRQCFLNIETHTFEF